MITVTIRQTALRVGIENAHQLQKLADLSPAVAADLWKGESLPRLETIDRLCAALKCDLKDLIRYTRSSKPTKNGRKQ